MSPGAFRSPATTVEGGRWAGTNTSFRLKACGSAMCTTGGHLATAAEKSAQELILLPCRISVKKVQRSVPVVFKGVHKLISMDFQKLIWMCSKGRRLVSARFDDKRLAPMDGRDAGLRALQPAPNVRADLLAAHVKHPLRYPSGAESNPRHRRNHCPRWRFGNVEGRRCVMEIGKHFQRKGRRCLEM